MALNSFLRRASCSLIPLSNSIIGSVLGGYHQRQQYSISLLNPENRSYQFLPFIQFSSSSTTAINESSNDGLDELPFDIKDGSLEEGYLTLIRKSPEEIIEVKVRPYYVWNWEITDNEEEEEEPLKLTTLEEALKILEDFEKGAEKSDREKLEQEKDYRVISKFYMLVKIYYGDEFLQFYVVANHNGEILIPSMSTSTSAEHLEDFEEMFKKRGMEASIFNSLFHFFEKRNKIETA